MFRKIYKSWVARQRRQRKWALDEIRGQFERHGYSLEDLTDSEVEEAITYYSDPIENAMPLTGKRIYWVLRRLSPDGDRFRGRRTDRARERGYPGKRSKEQEGGYLMDLSAIIVVIVLTAAALGVIVWLEIYSRRTQPKEVSADQDGSVTKSSNRSTPGL